MDEAPKVFCSVSLKMVTIETMQQKNFGFVDLSTNSSPDLAQIEHTFAENFGRQSFYTSLEFSLSQA